MDLDAKVLPLGGVTRERFGSAVDALRDNPYSIVVCKSSRDGPPQAYVISPTLYDMLQSHYKRCLELMKGVVSADEYRRLQAEAERNKNLLAALMAEMREKVGGDSSLSEGAWKEIYESVRESVEPDGELFPDTGEKRRVL